MRFSNANRKHTIIYVIICLNFVENLPLFHAMRFTGYTKATKTEIRSGNENCQATKSVCAEFNDEKPKLKANISMEMCVRMRTVPVMRRIWMTFSSIFVVGKHTGEIFVFSFDTKKKPLCGIRKLEHKIK